MKKVFRSLFACLLSLTALDCANAQVTTIVGGIANVGDGGLATNANVQAFTMAVDGSGNFYFVDNDGQSIRKLTIATGIISRVAGNGTQGFSGDNGPAVDAQLNYPTGVAIAANNDIIIADNGNSRIRRVSAATGVISTIAGNGSFFSGGDNGLAINAQFMAPFHVTMDAAGNIFITDLPGQRVRKIDAVTNIITTVAGNGNFGTSGDGGLATNAQFAFPWGASVDAAGNLFIVSISDYRIRKVTASTGIISTIAGDEFDGGFNGDNILATNAKMSPRGIAIDGSGNLYIAEESNNRVRRIDKTSGIINTIAGSGSTRGYSGDGGPASAAETNSPFSVVLDNGGNVHFFDYFNNRVRKVMGGNISTVAGTGIYGFNGDNIPATSCQLLYPAGITFDKFDNLYIADGSGSGRIRKVTKNTNLVTTLSTTIYARHLAFYGESSLYVAGSAKITKIDTSTGQETAIGGTGSYCSFNGDNIPATTALIQAEGLAVDKIGNVYFSDLCLNRIRKIDATTNLVTTIAGNGNAASSGDNGQASNAEVNNASILVFDALDRLYFIENQIKVRRIDLSSGIITTVATGFSSASSLMVDSDFSIYVGDGPVIKKIDAAGQVTTVAGTGIYGYNGEDKNPLDAQLGFMKGMASDKAKNLVISESNGRIRKIANLLSIDPTVATPASNISTSGFTANWNAGTSATGYELDISTDNFATFVTGYNAKSVTSISEPVTGLVANTTYQYRVRVVSGSRISPSSNVISVTLKQNQTITFTAPANKTVGDAPFVLTATASSGLAVGFSAPSDKVTISGSQVTLVNAGRVTIIANQAGNASFDAAPAVERSFCIAPVKPSVTVTNANTGTPVLTSSALSDNQWFLNGNAIVGATSVTYDAIASGLYKLQVKADDCTSDFSSDVNLIVLGDITTFTGVSLYPNPTEDYLQIRGLVDVDAFQLIDLAGRHSTISFERYSEGYRANVRELPSGVYFLRMSEGNMLHHFKFVKR